MNTKQNKMLAPSLLDGNNCTKETSGTSGGACPTTDLLLQLSISDGSLSGRDWTVVDDGSPLAVSIYDMAIDRVVTGVGLASYKPTISTWETKKKEKSEIGIAESWITGDKPRNEANTIW
jgi:hypothetical protein